MLLPCNELFKHQKSCKLSRGNIQGYYDLPMGFSPSQDTRYMLQLIAISKLIPIYSKLEHQVQCIRKSKHHEILYTGLDDSLKWYSDTPYKSKKIETILNPFMIHPPLNTFMRSTLSYKVEDSGLVAMLDVIKATQDNCAGHLLLPETVCFFHQAIIWRKLTIRLRIQFILFIRDIFIDIIRGEATKKVFEDFQEIEVDLIKNTGTQSEEITNLIQQYVLSIEEGEINKKATDVHNKLPEQKEDEDDIDFSLRVLGFHYVPSLVGNVEQVQKNYVSTFIQIRTKNRLQIQCLN